ncbi:MRG/MORF4L-binding protein isoform X3 [Helicoverpa armigera]|uniref:MRG/MORF4L-binding protein isoform X3 n=1 Tax=Helicoverpa zea TaxID=7113 RepID=UPI000B39EEC0|nr:MRG/MORF4L-binding protein isoform X3 [Helicoverpa zea]XP_049701937.1 MRG/MORF4L-binding protein isoform X3 [Helicoverpa armigera]
MVSSEEEPEVKTGEPLTWDVDMEIQLFYAMANHKPVGINKHFHMACIWEKLSNSITKEISTQDIWKRLESLYDLNLLEDTEPIPFPNHETPFSLPESEFGSLMKQKCKEAILAEDSEGSRKDSVSALATKTRKESGSSHASTDTPSIKSEKDYDRRRDSRDSNASGPRDSSSSRKSTSQRDKVSKSKVGSVAAAWDSPLIDEDGVSRRGRRRANTSTPPATTPAKRRRT